MASSSTALGLMVVFGGIMFGMFINPQQGVMILTGGLFLLAILAVMGDGESDSTLMCHILLIERLLTISLLNQRSETAP